MARVTQPIPDLTYGFLVISPQDDLFGILEGDHQVDRMSLLVLAKLRNRGKDNLISAPTTAPFHWAAKDEPKFLEAKYLMCFPWAIVGVKRGPAGAVADVEQILSKVEARATKEQHNSAIVTRRMFLRQDLHCKNIWMQV